jgi:hypothetical protein
LKLVGKEFFRERLKFPGGAAEGGVKKAEAAQRGAGDPERQSGSGCNGVGRRIALLLNESNRRLRELPGRAFADPEQLLASLRINPGKSVSFRLDKQEEVRRKEASQSQAFACGVAGRLLSEQELDLPLFKDFNAANLRDFRRHQRPRIRIRRSKDGDAQRPSGCAKRQAHRKGNSNLE